MKKSKLIICFVSIALITAFSYSFSHSGISKSARGYLLGTTFSGNPEIDKVKFQQTRAQVYLFEQALKEFSVASPYQVVQLWVKADQTRNGVLKYAVSCDDLKKKFIEKRGRAEESFWIIGGSSPWLDRYEIAETRKIDDFTYLYRLKYYWTTSAGDAEPETFSLTIAKIGGKWCVQHISDIDNLYTFSNN